MSVCRFKLYEISNDYERAIDALLLSEEEKDESKIAEIKDLFELKCINVAKYIKNMQAEADAIHKVMEQMAARVGKIEAHIDSLTAYLQYNMEKTGLTDTIKSPEFDIKLKTNPPSLLIENEELIPDIYVVTKEIKIFDKNAMKKDILDGFEIEGARVEQKKRVEIK